MDLTEEQLIRIAADHALTNIGFHPTTIFVCDTIARFLNTKSYGPYIRNGKQFYRNYGREIKRPDAKTFWEVNYLNLPIEWKPVCTSGSDSDS